MNPNDTDTTVLQFRISRATAAQIEQLAKIHAGIADADAGRFVSHEEVEAIANRYHAYRAAQAG